MLVLAAFTYSLTVWNFIRLLAFLVDDNDEYQNNDFSKDAQEGPEGGQVTSHTKHWGHDRGANNISGIALIISRIRHDVKINDWQLCVVVLVADEKAAGGVVNLLQSDSRGWLGAMWFQWRFWDKSVIIALYAVCQKNANKSDVICPHSFVKQLD